MARVLDPTSCICDTVSKDESTLPPNVLRLSSYTAFPDPYLLRERKKGTGHHCCKEHHEQVGADDGWGFMSFPRTPVSHATYTGAGEVPGIGLGSPVGA